MDPIESALLMQLKNNDLPPPDIPPQQKNLAVRPQCDICWKTFTRKYNLSRHRKRHFVETPQSLDPIESSAIMYMEEDTSTGFDKELFEESRDILKIYKLLQRIKQFNSSEE